MKTKKVSFFERNLNVYTFKENLFLSRQAIRGEIGRLNGACSDLENIPQIKLVSLGSFDQGLNLLTKNRLRGICGSHAAIYFVSQQLQIPIDHFKSVLVTKKMLSAHFHPNSSDKKIEKVRKAIQIIQKNGALQKIRNKYHDSDIQN